MRSSKGSFLFSRTGSNRSPPASSTGLATRWPSAREAAASGGKQTASATGEIAMQVEEVQLATGKTVDATQGILGVIQRISDNSAAIAAAIEEQDSSTQEIARSVQEAAAGTQLVSNSIEEVRQVAGETGASAAQVLEAAQSLSGQSDLLNKEIETFLESQRCHAVDVFGNFATLAERLELTPMTIRHHLNVLQAQNLVVASKVRRSQKRM